MPSTAKLGDMHPSLEKWDDLTCDQKKYAAKSMAINAGMIDAMDSHLGRLIEYLKNNGEY
ncbi:MAG: arylsulfatase A-like enzyme [Cryomorphaceae bacterium]